MEDRAQEVKTLEDRAQEVKTLVVKADSKAQTVQILVLVQAIPPLVLIQVVTLVLVQMVQITALGRVVRDLVLALVAQSLLLVLVLMVQPTSKVLTFMVLHRLILFLMQVMTMCHSNSMVHSHRLNRMGTLTILLMMVRLTFLCQRMCCRHPLTRLRKPTITI